MASRMAEGEEAEIRRARERLAAMDELVATLIAAGAPAAELAAHALAANGGYLARANLHLDRHVSRGLLRTP